MWDSPRKKQALLDKYFLAADRRDYATFKQCLRTGVDPNSYDPSGQTALHIAALNGDEELCRIILSARRVDVDRKTKHLQVTALHLASCHERLGIVKLLISKGAHINTINRNGQSSLHIATALSNLELVKLLLVNQADVNVVDVFDHTPLSLAVLDSRDFTIAELLLRNGADVEFPRPYSISLFHEAVLNFHGIDCLPFLILLHDHGADSRKIDWTGKNAWHYAALNGCTILGMYLHYLNCPDDLPDYTNRTPYNIAMEHGNFNIAALLMKYQGARVRSTMSIRKKMKVLSVKDFLGFMTKSQIWK